MLQSRKVWADTSDSTAIAPGVEYADYNLEFGTTLLSQRYEWKGINFSTAAALTTASGLAGNDIEADPLFVDPDNGNYRLQQNSPARGAGVSQSDQGIYLTGFEIVGAANPLPADFNLDLKVGGADLFIWEANYGASGSSVSHGQGDADLDQNIDGADFLAWQRDFCQPAVLPPSALSALSVANRNSSPLEAASLETTVEDEVIVSFSSANPNTVLFPICDSP